MEAMVELHYLLEETLQHRHLLYLVQVVPAAVEAAAEEQNWLEARLVEMGPLAPAAAMVH
jgi:hypothetical protein